jgi:hypothetical protein
MSRVDDPTIKMELEDLDGRVDKLEQSIKGDRESSSSKNSDAQLNTYRVIKEGGNHYVEFKHKDGWVRSSSSTFNLR